MGQTIIVPSPPSLPEACATRLPLTACFFSVQARTAVGGTTMPTAPRLYTLKGFFGIFCGGGLSDGPSKYGNLTQLNSPPLSPLRPFPPHFPPSFPRCLFGPLYFYFYFLPRLIVDWFIGWLGCGAADSCDARRDRPLACAQLPGVVGGGPRSHFLPQRY